MRERLEIYSISPSRTCRMLTGKPIAGLVVLTATIIALKVALLEQKEEKSCNTSNVPSLCAMRLPPLGMNTFNQLGVVDTAN